MANLFLIAKLVTDILDGARDEICAFNLPVKRVISANTVAAQLKVIADNDEDDVIYFADFYMREGLPYCWRLMVWDALDCFVMPRFMEVWQS